VGDSFLKRVEVVKDLLEATYHCPRHHNRDDVVDELVFILLSQMTHEKGYLSSFEALKARYPGWHEVMVANTDELASTIRAGGLGEIKGPRIQAILKRVFEDFGTFDLSFMRSWDQDSVYEYLTSLPGIGCKSALCVMMYALDMSVFPVDVNVRRVFARVGLIEASWSHRKAQAYLSREVPGEWGSSLHTNGLAHGRAICRPSRPMCNECVLYAQCAMGGLDVQRGRLASVEFALRVGEVRVRDTL